MGRGRGAALPRPAKERSGKNSRNSRKKRGGGVRNNPNFFVENVEQPRTCKYCPGTFWALEQSRREYCDPKRERKLYMYRRQALIEAAFDLLRWRGVLKEWVVRMVDTCHDAVLAALKALGCVWNEALRKCQWVETRRSA